MKLHRSLFLTFFGIQISLQTTIAQIQRKPSICSLSALDSLKNYSGIVVDYYANGSPFLWKTMQNGKADGLWLEWYADGTLRYRANWKNNKGNGKWEYFHTNGKLRSESFYTDDKAQGFYRSYYNNGQLQTEATYLNDKKEGIEFTYNTDGTLQHKKLYENNTYVINEPILFESGNISTTTNNEWGICFTPTGDTAYFTRRDANTKEKRIYSTVKNTNGWSVPTIAFFSTSEDESPFVSKDGSTLFFASFKPLPNFKNSQKNDMNIWYIDKQYGKYTTPKPLLDNINKPMLPNDKWPTSYEAGPITDSMGNLYYWAKSSTTQVTNLYFAPIQKNGNFNKPIELIEPSSNRFFDSAPCLSPDENLLLFASDNRPNSWGSDIFYSKKINGKWSSPKNLGTIVNSYSDDSFPSFSPDGKYFFFSSNRAGNKDANGEAIWDLYYMETRFLILE